MMVPYIATFIMGAILGSFLNVVGLRFLREESIVWPGSHCYACNAKIKPYDNIPVLSWLILGGKCRNCKAGISIQYPIVELLTGLLFLATVMTFGFAWQTIFLLFLICNFMVILITDFREQAIFDINSLGLIPFGLVYSYLNLGGVPGTTAIPLGFTVWTVPSIFISSLLAMAAAFLIFFVLNVISRLFADRDGFGQGDTHLLLGIGAFFGLKLTIIIFVLSFLMQAAMGLPMVVYQWFKYRLYQVIALEAGAFVLVVILYTLPLWIHDVLLLQASLLLCFALTVFCVLRGIWVAKSSPAGLTAIPFGPAIILACLLVVFFESRIVRMFEIIFGPAVQSVQLLLMDALHSLQSVLHH